MPVRSIVRKGERDDHRIASYIMGVVSSPAFRMQRIEVAVDDK